MVLSGGDLREISLDLLRGAQGDELFEIGAAHAVDAGAAHDDDAALRTAGFGCGDGLGRLIEVLVQRVAAVGGDDDVAFYDGALRLLTDKGDARSMSLLQVTGKGSYDILFFAQGHIQDELHILPRSTGSAERTMRSFRSLFRK